VTARPVLPLLRRIWDVWSFLGYQRSLPHRARRHYLSLVLSRWRRWVLRGNLGAPDVFDEEEAVFGDVDLLPKERKEEVRGLRQFLIQGQPEWRQDGGVVVPEMERDVRMGPVMQCIAKGLKLRPGDVIPKWADAREYVGTFWERSDFETLPPVLLELVDECRELEEQQIASIRLHGHHSGSSISEEGCRQLGVPEELTR